MLNKIKNLILSVIFPRRMYRFHKLNIFYSVIILIATALLVLLSVNLSTERFTRQMIDTLDFENTTYKLKEEFNLPEYSILQSNTGGYYLDVNVASEDNTYQGKFVTTLVDDDNNELELTIVFDEACDLFKEENRDINVDSELFDLNAYMMQYRNDSRNDVDKEYLLFVFTKKSFYYLYNLGQVQDPYGDWTDAQNRSYSSYEKSSTGEDKYFIPSNATEAAARDEYGNYDVTKWTTETTSDTYSEEYDGVKYLAEKRINSNIRTAIYNGEYVYGNLDIEKIKSTENPAHFYNNKDIIDAIYQHVELMVASDASIQKSMYSFFAILINVFISFVWVFITWLLSRKFIMNKFREYYAICAISYIPVSFVAFILGFFVRFENLMLFLLIGELIFYIVATFRINTDPKLLNEEKEDDGNDDVQKPHNPFEKEPKPEIKFNKISSEDSYTVE